MSGTPRSNTSGPRDGPTANGLPWLHAEIRINVIPGFRPPGCGMCDVGRQVECCLSDCVLQGVLRTFGLSMAMMLGHSLHDVPDMGVPVV